MSSLYHLICSPSLCEFRTVRMSLGFLLLSVVISLVALRIGGCLLTGASLLYTSSPSPHGFSPGSSVSSHSAGESNLALGEIR